jgi:phosphoglycolate phosphatase
MLAGLLRKSIKTAIITRNCDAAVRLVFPDIGNHCHAFFARDHVQKPKPDPAHLIHALQAMDADLGTALMVGDHPIDIQTGKAAGIHTAGVCSGHASRESLIQSGADWVARDCEELMTILAEQGMFA